MEQQNFRKQYRYWILLNYLSLIAVLVFFYTGKYFQSLIVSNQSKPINLSLRL
jgi:hypothetical protein